MHHVKGKGRRPWGDREAQTIAGERAQRSRCLLFLKGTLVPSTHLNQLTTIRTSPVPGNPMPSSGFYRHSHTWNAHKLT